MVRCEVLEFGEQALLYKYTGHVELLKGPKRIWLYFSKLTRLNRYSAQNDEYLKITLRNGEVEHRVGPCDEYLNPQVHASIKVEKSFCLNAYQAIIVYSNGKDGDCKQEIIRGPNVYVLKPKEWVHEFSWHGSDDSNKTTYSADKDQFKILNCAPGQFYYNVREVRTSDDALIRIKLMIFHELKDIKKLLIETKDPMADFINCCCADVIAFVADKTYMDFIDKSSQLNELQTYRRLVERASKIGYDITKVVFRGYLASPKLQQMHDSSINTRTKLKLEYESEVARQESEYYNLETEIKRLESEQSLEFKKLDGQHDMEKSSILNKSKNDLDEKLKKLELNKNLELAQLQLKKSKNQREVEYLKNLQNNLNVNLDDYLSSTIKKASRIIEIRENGDNNTSNIHFHNNN